MKNLFRIIPPVIAILILTGCKTGQKESFDGDWLTIAIETERFIKEAKYESPVGTCWRVMPDSLNSAADLSLYSGVPGIVLFYLELYSATNNPAYLKEAEAGADFLIASIKDEVYEAEEVGLYTGLSGMGYALLEIYRITNKPIYKTTVLQTVELLEQSAARSESGIIWGGITDIVYGASGIGLYLQYVADALDYPGADSLAIMTANGLIDLAIISPAGWRWKYMPSYERFMDNFSHGTAGVGYFLSETFRRTGDKKFLEGALGSAGILDSLENDKGYIPHHCPGGEDLYYLNWCHGPAGTGRLYYSLYEASKDEKWLEKLTFSADHLMQEGLHEHEAPGYWNNYGKCCGSVSLAEYYLWLFEITENVKYLEYSHIMTDQLLSHSTKENGYLKWVHAENRTSPENIAAQTGLMQGSAGIGLWFLQLHAFQDDKKPLIRLPDKPDR